MATINKRGTRYHVRIRLKEKNLSATFADLHTAELWAKYKEDITEKIEHFDVPMPELVTFRDAVQLKVDHMKSQDLNHKSIADVECTSTHDFSEYNDKPLAIFSYGMLIKKTEQMLQANVRRGGSEKPNTGYIRRQSPVSVLKKLRVLGSILSHAISKGIPCENHVPKVTAYLSAKLNA